MTLNYKLTNSDFLEYQLFTSSKSKLHRNRRFRSRILVPLLYMILGLYFYFRYQYTAVAIFFVGFASLWFFLHPNYSKWRYKKHFQKHIAENYKNRINQEIQIDFDENSINSKDVTSVSRINGSELKELIEIKEHFFIKLSTDLSIIVPKHSIENQTKFKELVTELGAEYIDELHWQWK